MYDPQCHTIGKPNDLNVFRSKKSTRCKNDSQNRQTLMPEGE